MHKSQSQEMCDPFYVGDEDTSWVRRELEESGLSETKIGDFIMGEDRGRWGETRVYRHRKTNYLTHTFKNEKLNIAFLFTSC